MRLSGSLKGMVDRSRSSCQIAIVSWMLWGGGGNESGVRGSLKDCILVNIMRKAEIPFGQPKILK